jgi:flagellar motor switch protein FliN
MGAVGGNPAGRGLEWLLEEWATRLSAGYEAMAGEPLSQKPVSVAPPGTDSFIWRQPFDVAEGAAVEVAIPAAGWRLIGGRILAAAGIEEATDEDSRPTYLEVLQQSLSGLASALAAALGREVSCGKGEEAPSMGAAPGVQFGAAGQIFSCRFSATEALLDALRPPPPTAVAPPALAGTQLAPAATSNPFELLYDVELPVSVSFGRAHLPVKEVLKLASGSIVELNRGIAEPVEIIVNNCVIARGEVVVVEGNYGVRILEIISRSERLRTLH